jgi:hypothetical protein
MNDHMELTDWMPCTMRPLRDGEYECKYSANLWNMDGTKFRCDSFRARFKDGSWPIDRPGLNNTPQNFKWRGVRRWVLIEAWSRPALSVTKKTKRGFSFGPLVRAIGFDSKEEAESFAAKHPRYNLKAVLP